MGGSRGSLFDDAGIAFITDALEAVPDKTCRELVSAYEQEFGGTVGRWDGGTVGLSTMNDRVRKMGYTRKRGFSGRQRRNVPMSLNAETPSSASNRLYRGGRCR
jgi:hypothetical protein